MYLFVLSVKLDTNAAEIVPSRIKQLYNANPITYVYSGQMYNSTRLSEKQLPKQRVVLLQVVVCC